jgi:hypothetical protein
MRSMHIAKGELWLREAAGGAPRHVESPFARDVVERDAQSRRNTSWKSAPREEQQGVIPNNMLWGNAGVAKPLAPPRFLHARPGAEPGVLYYLLAVGESTGLFRQHLDEHREVRLFHRHDFRCLGFDYGAVADRIVLARANPDRTAHLEVYDTEGNLKGAVTGGDCVDAAPSFVPGAPTTVVFQSAGAARRPQDGFVVAVGHVVVNRLDYASGRLETLIDDARYDHVAPRMDAAGNLYAIRRPFEKPATQTLATTLTDALLFPWRLLKAIFGYLNFFSMIYGREPLRSAGGPRTPELDQDLGRLWLHGRMIELAKLAPDAKTTGGLVPRSWELVRRDPGGNVEVLARHVVSFDLSGDGVVVWSNGFEVYTLRAGERGSLGRGELVESVAAL